MKTHAHTHREKCRTFRENLFKNTEYWEEFIPFQSALTRSYSALVWIVPKWLRQEAFWITHKNRLTWHFIKWTWCLKMEIYTQNGVVKKRGKEELLTVIQSSVPKSHVEKYFTALGEILMLSECFNWTKPKPSPNIKAALTNIFMVVTDWIIMCNVKGVARSDKSTVNYPSALHFLSALWVFLASWSSLCLFLGTQLYCFTVHCHLSHSVVVVSTRRLVSVQ